MVITGIALILIAALGVGAVTAWGKSWSDISTIAGTFDKIPASAENEIRAQSKCAECGIVESIREITRAGDKNGVGSVGATKPSERSKSTSKQIIPAAHYEMTVRMRNGSSRVFTDTNPANWRAGERVTLIEGSDRAVNCPPLLNHHFDKEHMQC